MEHSLSSTIAASDFGRVLRLLAVDPEFEREVLHAPGAALRPFQLDPDEVAVLSQYRRWRIVK
jgi:hypothetical protein